tara:strand:+ start:7006 stop:9450 length:2445 start_codon:yes stop_codon:yes gene_type:complete
MILNKIENFYKTFLKFKIFIAFLIVLLTIFNLLNLNKFKLDASADTLILENDNDYKIFKKISKIFPSKPFLILAYKSENNIIDKKYIENVVKLKNEIETIKGIESTFSIVDAPIIDNEDISLNELNLDKLKTINSENINIQAALNELINNPIFQNQLINSDATVSSIIIYLENDIEFKKISNLRDDIKLKILNDENINLKNDLKIINKDYEKLKENYNKNRHQLISQIRDKIDKFHFNENLFLGGVDMIADDSLEFVKKDIMNFGIGVFIFIILILSFLFRNIKWVVLPILTTTFAISSIISFLGIIGWKVTVISSNFISLMIILTISMNVHIIVRYKIIYEKSKNNNFNISKTMKEMFLPCLYTSLTTIVAFLSLIFSDIRPVIDFGWIMTIGLSITFFSSFIILPILISFFPESEKYENRNVYIIRILFKAVKEYGIWILSCNLILFLISIWGLTNLKVENSFINYFKEKTEIHKGMKIIDTELGGTTPLDLIIEFNENEKIISNNENNIDDLGSLFEENENTIQNWITSDKLKTIKEIQEYLENKNEIGKVQSIQSFINLAEKIHKSPLDSFQLSILYNSVPTDLKENLLGQYISLDENLVRFNARIIDSMNIERNKLINDIKNDLNNKFENVKNIEVNGLLVLYNNMLQSLFTSQIKSLIFVLLAIFIMFIILFKSFILSIVGIIPNIFAALFILGLIGIFKIPLDMMTITIAAITIGIAVDNSIHYIYRIKKELENKNLIESIKECHLSVGNAILTTSITIAFGFSILLLSNFLPTIYFGIFTSIAMIIAMLGIMTTLPKLLILLGVKK